jgi:hypothetical protein
MEPQSIIEAFPCSHEVFDVSLELCDMRALTKHIVLKVNRF